MNPNDSHVISLFENHVNPALSQVMKFIGFDSVEESARGCVIRDSRGREFLDCLGGFGTLSLGHSHPRVVEAVKAQLDKMAFSSRVLFNEPQARLAAKLAKIAPGDLQFAFFCNSGAEAAEAAIKFARITTKRKKTGLGSRRLSRQNAGRAFGFGPRQIQKTLRAAASRLRLDSLQRHRRFGRSRGLRNRRSFARTDSRRRRNHRRNR